jgi:hypothetical protein
MSSSQSSQPTFLGIAPRFVVRDLEQALAFYGQLGFQTTYHDADFAIVKRDGVDLHQNSSPDPPKGHSVCWIAVTNIDPCTSTICRPMLFSLLWSPSRGVSRSFSSETPLETSFSLLKASPKRKPVPNREDEGGAHRLHQDAVELEPIGASHQRRQVREIRLPVGQHGAPTLLLHH